MSELLEAITRLIQENTGVIGLAAKIFVGIEIIGAIFAILLFVFVFVILVREFFDF